MPLIEVTEDELRLLNARRLKRETALGWQGPARYRETQGVATPAQAYDRAANWLAVARMLDGTGIQHNNDADGDGA